MWCRTVSFKPPRFTRVNKSLKLVWHLSLRCERLGIIHVMAAKNLYVFDILLNGIKVSPVMNMMLTVRLIRILHRKRPFFNSLNNVPINLAVHRLWKPKDVMWSLAVDSALMNVKNPKVNALMVDKIIVDKNSVGNVWVKSTLIPKPRSIFDIVKKIANMLHWMVNFIFTSTLLVFRSIEIKSNHFDEKSEILTFASSECKWWSLLTSMCIAQNDVTRNSISNRLNNRFSKVFFLRKETFFDH